LGIVRPVFDDQGFHPQRGHVIAGAPAGVALLDAAGQGAFRAHGDAVATGKAVAHQQAGRKDQPVARPQGIAVGNIGVHQDTGQQPAAA